MQQTVYPQRVIARHVEGRHEIDLPALMIIDERDPVAGRLSNLSRHGFRLTLPGTFPAGFQFTLKVDKWPRLRGHVVWSAGGRTGCLFSEPPGTKVFAMMIQSAGEIEREGF